MDEPKEQEMQEQEKPVFSAEERDKLLARIDELEKALAEEKAKRAEEERQAEEAEFSRFAQKELIDTGRLPAVEKERLIGDGRGRRIRPPPRTPRPFIPRRRRRRPRSAPSRRCGPRRRAVDRKSVV